MLNYNFVRAGILLIGAIVCCTSAQASTRFHHNRAVHESARVYASAHHRHAGQRHFAEREWRGHRRFRHVAARHTRFASRDSLIRSYVGPSTDYVPTASSGGGVQTGRASYYSGGRTASGGSVGAATCAHRSLPFGTRVLVTNLANLRQAVLTVNDRGPFVRGRVVDVSRGAAGMLGMLQSGVASVRVQVLGASG